MAASQSIPSGWKASLPRAWPIGCRDYQWIDWTGRDDAVIARLIAAIKRQGEGPVVPSTPKDRGKAKAWLPSRTWLLLAGIGLTTLVGLLAAWWLWSRPATGPYALQPGRWVARREVTQILYPEVAPELARQIEQSFENDPNPDECISQAVARAPDVRLFDPRGEGRCTLTSFDMAGGRVSGNLTCSPPGATESNMQVTLRGSYTATSIDLENEITFARPGSLIRLRARDTTRWVAYECAPERR